MEQIPAESLHYILPELVESRLSHLTTTGGFHSL
jgi:hypothetical protein